MPKMKLKKYTNGTGKLKGDTSGTGINPNTRPSYNGQEYSNAKSVVIPKGGATNKYDYDIRRTADGSDYYEPKAAPKVVARTTTPAKPVTPVKTNVTNAPANIKPEYTPGKKTIRIPSSDPRLAHDNKYATYKTVVRDISEEEEDTRLSKNLNVRASNNGTKVIPTTPSTNVAKLKKGGTIGKYTDGTSAVATKKSYNSAGQEIQLAKPRPNYGGYIPSNQITARPTGRINTVEAGNPMKYGKDISSYVHLSNNTGIPKKEKGGVIGKVKGMFKKKEKEAPKVEIKKLNSPQPEFKTTKGTGVSFRSEAAEYKPKYDTSKGGTVAVAKYQEKLNKETGSKLKVDGVWGDKTDAAYSKSLVKKNKESKVTAKEIGATPKDPVIGKLKGRESGKYAKAPEKEMEMRFRTPAKKSVYDMTNPSQTELDTRTSLGAGMSETNLRELKNHTIRNDVSKAKDAKSKETAWGKVGRYDSAADANRETALHNKKYTKDVLTRRSNAKGDQKGTVKQIKDGNSTRKLPSIIPQGDTARDLANRAGRYGDTDDAGFAVGMGAKEGIKKGKEEGSDWKTVAGAVATGIAVNYAINKFQKRKGGKSNIPFRGTQIGSSKSTSQKQLGVGGSGKVHTPPSSKPSTSGKTHYMGESTKTQGQITKGKEQKLLTAGTPKPRVRVKVGTPPKTEVKAPMKKAPTKKNSSKKKSGNQTKLNLK